MSDQNNALVPSNLNLPASPFSDDLFGEVAKAGNYLPRLSVMSYTSKLAQDDKVKPGNWVLVISDAQFIDLGPAWDGLVLDWRPCALHIGDGGVTSYYDPTLPDFKKIQESARAPGGFERGDSAGPQFLVWVGKQKRFATFFASSKTAIKEAQNLKPVVVAFRDEKKLPAITFKSSKREIKEKNQRWQGPNFFNCTAYAEPLPDWTKYEEERGRFLNPPKTEKEKIDPKEASERAM